MTDPWYEIADPVQARFSGRRADVEHQFNFFWAKNLEGRCLLIFEYPDSLINSDRRPNLKEVRIIEPKVKGEPSRLILELTQSSNREIFYRLCLDIIDSTRVCADEKAALGTIIRRTWRWHGMLKGVAKDRLSAESQKGLIGELRVLELAMLPFFSAGDAVEFWRGPEGTPKDFSIGDIAIESKAKRGAARPYVKISSEFQLDMDGLSRLYLAVTYVDETAQGASDGLTLTDYVEVITQLVASNDAGSVGCLEGKLFEAGYSDEQDYSDCWWLVGQTRWFDVRDSFPRLMLSNVPDGIEQVSYNLDVGGCSDWEVTIDSVGQLLTGVTE